ncbi:E3 ubiquitin-protein ligase RNF167-like [Erythrolamprus reginae]|uniref:E3 ubiquitin-protein ligase RNF167-like n=1 Tax=Erythrolamprus reginae TaxID=121349 RepID=UPI00396C46C2
MRCPFPWSWHTVSLFLILQVVTTKASSHTTCNPNSTLLDVEVLPDFFQPLLPLQGLLGLWVKVKPSSPYHGLQGPPPSASLFVVLSRQHNCSFSKKILHAQQVGSHTAIVHNVSSQMLEDVVSEPGSQWHLHIPATFSAEETAKVLKHLHLSGKSLLALPKRERFHFAWKAASRISRLEAVRSPCQCLLQPASFCCQTAMFYTCWIVCLTVSATFIIMMLTEHCFSWSKRKRVRRNHRLLREREKEPVHVSFTGSSKYQECAICLDRYLQYDGVKVLSCSHAFHSRCIDLWHITQARNKTCPLCMQKVMVVTHLMALRLWQQEKSVGHCELTENETYPTCNHVSCWQNHAVPISQN